MSIISNFPISSGTGSGLAIYGPLRISGYDQYETVILTSVIPKIAILYQDNEIVIAIMNDFNDNNSGYTCYTHQRGKDKYVQLGCNYMDDYYGQGSALYIDYLGTGAASYGSGTAYVVG